MSDTIVPQSAFNYVQTAEAILGALRNERDRQIVAQRYGLGLPKRHTLEKIGSQFGITRERVRQIEKAATVKLQQTASTELTRIDNALKQHLARNGQVDLLQDVAAAVGAHTPAQQAYISFLAALAPSIEIIEDSDHYHSALSTLPEYHKQHIAEITSHLVHHLKQKAKPTPIDALHKAIPYDISKQTTQQVARVSKRLAHHDGHWGLSHWPEVNPRSIRDKTYLVLGKHGQPLHFTDIATHIAGLGNQKRSVTTQAVHNELIKDPRFVLVGRGIYALSEWGYTPGTVADIITEVLRDESPLHKDEIVKRVLQKRQVKTTTIVLNLQEKDQFIRVSKATYALK
ncbi:MAG TPA: sigma factor-like helix-turn-helix DNA-binding protein [Candidatus Saccharimonadia bacterium]